MPDILSRCPKCDRTGHIFNDCTLLTEIERLYEVDRLKPGENFDNYEETEVNVTTPEDSCPGCGNERRPNDRICVCIEPISDFTDIGIGGQLLKNITNQNRCGYKKPTRIQQFALPMIKKGYDVIGCAQTGTGKTAAYLIPLLKLAQERGYRKRPDQEIQTPEILILAPTRELVQQIKNCALKISNRQTQYSVKALYGRSGGQEIQVKEGCNVLIGTPGRVKTLLQREKISLENVSHFVLDEADKMIVGFSEDIREIERDMKPKEERQTLMFSATFQRTLIERTARSFMREDYRLIEAGEIGSAQTDVRQIIDYVESDDQKIHKLKEILEDLLKPDVERLLACHCWKDGPAYAEDRELRLTDFYLHILGPCLEKKILIFVGDRRRLTDERLSEEIADHLCRIFKGYYYSLHRDVQNRETNCLNENDSTSEFGVFPLHGDQINLPHVAGPAAHEVRGQPCDHCYSPRSGGRPTKINQSDRSWHIDLFGVLQLHGQINQSDRDCHVELFRAGDCPILLATDVAAKGLNIQGITHVINYDLPDESHFDEYVQRIGRTGIARNNGELISLFQRGRDEGVAVELARIVVDSQQDIPEWLQEIADERLLSQLISSSLGKL